MDDPRPHQIKLMKGPNICFSLRPRLAILHQIDLDQLTEKDAIKVS